MPGKHFTNDVGQRPKPAVNKDDFAKQLGYVSYLDMFETSTPVASGDAKVWAVTPTKHGKWLAWNEQDLPSYHEFDDRAAAVQYVKHVGGEAAPAPPNPTEVKAKPQFNQS